MLNCFSTFYYSSYLPEEKELSTKEGDLPCANENRAQHVTQLLQPVTGALLQTPSALRNRSNKISTKESNLKRK